MSVARAVLEHIGDFIAQGNPRRAATFVTEPIGVCQRLADAPEGYPLVPRFLRSGVRRRAYGNYLVFYRATPGRIDVLHVLNGAQDYEAILFPEG